MQAMTIEPFNTLGIEEDLTIFGKSVIGNIFEEWMKIRTLSSINISPIHIL